MLDVGYWRLELGRDLTSLWIEQRSLNHLHKGIEVSFTLIHHHHGDDNSNGEEDVITGFKVIVGTAVIGGLCSAVVCAVVISIVWMVAIVPSL